jgi:competence protein ComFB
MDLKTKYDFGVLVNETEHMVIEELERQLDDAEEKGICTCEECVLDMAGHALNNLRPHYRVSLLGTLYAHASVEDSYTKEIAAAVSTAIAKIHANPAHD